MPAPSLLLIFPLLAALLFAVGALVFKRSSDLGVGVWRTTFVANLLVAGLFSFLWLVGGPPVQVSLLWQPALLALCLFSGQLLQFVALERGDVSVAVPVFGLKVVIIALVTPFFIGEAVEARLWSAAVLSVLALVFLNRKEAGVRPTNVSVTLIAGGAGSICFAVFDVLVQKWGPSWGVGRLLPCVFWMNALLSLTLVTRFRAPLSQITSQAWPWLITGALLLGVQSIIFVSYVATHGQATAANVLYASRGLLSVLLIWSIGHWFSNAEQKLGLKVLRWRLLGATLMLAAIVLVMTR
jgi:drug/metabolite transporter (DMT)-like permease